MSVFAEKNSKKVSLE